MKEKKWLFEKNELIGRLSRAEGQVRAVKEKFSEKHDPASMLQQLAAARNAIDRVGRLALMEYIKAEISESSDPVSSLEAYSKLVNKYGW